MEDTNIIKTRTVKDAVFLRILEDKKLRDVLSSLTGTRDHNVCTFARRKSQNRIKNIDIIEAIKNHTGWGDAEIFENH